MQKAAKKIIIESSYYNEVKSKLKELFSNEKESVFYSRQLEIRFEDDYFHWITNRAISELIQEGYIKSETRKLITGNEIKLLWNKNYRYYKRGANKIVDIIQELSNPNIGASLGTHCELLVLEGFAKQEFILKGRNCKECNGKVWEKTDHDMDFIFCKDSVCYGVEVKNKLGYMEKTEIDVKIKLCKHLGIKPVFVVRMIPKTWINEIINNGGFVLILKYQLYPLYNKDFADRIKSILDLPVGYPKSLKEETMHRFIKWHKKNVK